MVKLEQKIEELTALGEFLIQFSSPKSYAYSISEELESIIQNIHSENAWFTEKNVRHSIKVIGESLAFNNIVKWVNKYNLTFDHQPKRIGVVTAGNIPLVGFHDFLSVIITGNTFYGKLSSKDNKLIKTISKFLIDINPIYKEQIIFEDNHLKNFDAVIATGSNNTSRYFEYYFGKHPNIIRKNRNSVALLTGNETDEEIRKLGNDIFDYFGLGCRNVSKLYIPLDLDFEKFFTNLGSFQSICHHNKYANNYDYNKSIFLMNQIQHLDNGFLILKEDPTLNSPIGVVHFQYYLKLDQAIEDISRNKDDIQCIVAQEGLIENSLPFGVAQHPKLWDYADNIDTIQFLLTLR